jgi:hypothetical protein
MKFLLSDTSFCEEHPKVNAMNRIRISPNQEILLVFMLVNFKQPDIYGNDIYTVFRHEGYISSLARCPFPQAIFQI